MNVDRDTFSAISAESVMLREHAAAPFVTGACWAIDGPKGLAAGCARFRHLPGATPLTCADFVRRGWPAGPFAAAKGLLMRFGFAPIRGSNPRASAREQGLCASGAEPLIHVSDHCRLQMAH